MIDLELFAALKAKARNHDREVVIRDKHFKLSSTHLTKSYPLTGDGIREAIKTMSFFVVKGRKFYSYNAAKNHADWLAGR